MGSPDQARDDHGRWTADGGSSGGATSRWADRAAKPTVGESRTWTNTPPKGSSDETWKDHFDKHPDEGGHPTDARASEVHSDIISKALDVKPPGPGEQKLAIMTMGAPASGKSSALRGVDTAKFVKVDPDAIKEQLPEYKAATSDRNATFRGAALMAHEESSYIAKQVLAKAMSNGNHIIVDGTGAKLDAFVAKMKSLQAAGYHVHVAMPHLEEEEGIKRMVSRAESTGRMVPEEFARAAYKSIPRNFERIAKQADSAVLYDNSGKSARKVYETSKRGGTVEHDPAFMRAFRSKHGKGDG